MDAILLSKCSVLTLLSFLDTARDSLPFFTKCCEPSLPDRNRREPGSRGVFFHLSTGLMQLIRSVVVTPILELSAYDARTAEAHLEFAEGLERPLSERHSCFVWYTWERGCSLRMPHWNGNFLQADLLDEQLPGSWNPLIRKQLWPSVAVGALPRPLDP